MQIQDEQMVRQAQRGDACAFTELVSRYRSLVFGLAYHYLGNAEDAQDVAQEAFVDAYLHLPELRDLQKFAPWLKRIALNRCAAALRQRGCRLLVSLQTTPLMEERGERGMMKGRNHDPNDPWEHLTRRLIVEKALNALSDRTRLTVILFYLAGYSHAEIAGFLEIPLNTVRSRLQYAKRQLREELMQMFDDAKNANTPDPQFARQVVLAAMQRAEEAQQAHKRSDALRGYDEALTALEQWKPDEEQRRLKIEALRKKGDATQALHRGYGEAISCFEQALALAAELGDAKTQADLMMMLGMTCSNDGQKRKAEEYYRQALKLYQDLGDTGGQGQCLFMLGMSHLWDDHAGKVELEQALPLLEAIPHHQGVAICRASLDLHAAVEEATFPALLGWRAGGDVLKQQGQTVSYAWNFGVIENSWSDRPEERSLAIIESIFTQIGHLRKFLDAGTPVGEGWSGEMVWNESPLLEVEITVKSRSEHVSVPAGEFENCLLMEQVTQEKEQSGEGREEIDEDARREFCGKRRAWYAPGVGLIQLHVQRIDGVEALQQLRKYTAQGEGYLPLAVGNTWTYGWADVPAEYVAEDVYRVTGRQDDYRYLEHYSFAYKRADG